MKGRIIYGGCFNPLHIGHMRLAIEIHNLFRNQASVLDFFPCYSPPHKRIPDLLPYGLRLKMIRKTIGRFPCLQCNDMESELPRPAYTYDTLQSLGMKFPGERFYFLVGSGDFLELRTWKNGLGIPEECELIVVPRGEYGRDDFYDTCRKYWPGGYLEDGPEDACLEEGSVCYRTQAIRGVYFADIPFLDISATRIRRLWLCGGNLDFMVPKEVLSLLNEEKVVARESWEEKKDKC